MVARRGDIWWATLDDAQGSAPGYKRPVLVIQANSFNRSRINTVIVAVLTSNLSRAEAPGNVFIAAKASNLPKDSVVNVSQLLTLDINLLAEKTGELPVRLIEKVNSGLRLVLSL